MFKSMHGVGSPCLDHSYSHIFFMLSSGEASVVPLAKAEWAKGARNLLESEVVRRDNRQGGEEETSILP
jgi:hypothetical protein